LVEAGGGLVGSCPDYAFISSDTFLEICSLSLDMSLKACGEINECWGRLLPFTSTRRTTGFDLVPSPDRNVPNESPVRELLLGRATAKQLRCNLVATIKKQGSCLTVGTV
jgi:hypothetical protein